ncbi:PREDICTED: exosome complex component RRP41-like [Chrysochloris asiatica]|uniref:Exosome complex component RRP41-like n=1 Tax=Chrysochloris asiatica TaxID=185453 RepID=A0A9B0UAX5_CHRAS|nr:PREDICTED: exosome complex component RRP41-like [Chrysochloris asiatica]
MTFFTRQPMKNGYDRSTLGMNGKTILKTGDDVLNIEQGNTKALAVVYGPHEIQSSRERALPHRALVNFQYSSATFSTRERKRRPHGDHRSCKMDLQLCQTFDAAILTQLHPYSQTDIYTQVLQADGGTYVACVNAATLAVMDAGIPMRDFVCACSAGFVDGTALAEPREEINKTPGLSSRNLSQCEI